MAALNFGQASPQRIVTFIQRVKPMNTARNRHFVWNQFVKFCVDRGYTLTKDSSVEQIAYILKDWGTSMRKCNGDDYKEYSVKTIWNVTAKLIQEKYFNEYKRNINPFFDQEFKCARDARDAKRKQLQSIPEKRKTSTITTTTASTTTSPNASTLLEDGYIVEAENTQPGSSTFVEMPTTVVTKSKKRQRPVIFDKKEGQEHELLQFMKQNFKPADEYSAFGELVGHKIRKLRTERLRNIAQNRINNILFELEMSEENNQCLSPNSAMTSLSVLTPDQHQSSIPVTLSPPLQPVVQVKTEILKEEDYMFESETTFRD